MRIVCDGSENHLFLVILNCIFFSVFSTGEDQEKRPRSETFADRLHNIEDSDFKRAYVANVHANQVNLLCKSSYCHFS